MAPGSPDSTGAGSPPTASGGRRRLFAVLTVLLPFAGLLLVEGGLRLAGSGQTHPLFVPAAAGSDYAVANSRAIRRFVPNPTHVPRLKIRPVVFRPDKGTKTLRIVVQGGSSAAGYPYGYGASPAGMLQQRLQRTFPDRKVEVITTATSAINSYTLLDFSREILEQEPDAVVIYAGHNEYLGILGVGSSFSAGRRRPLVLAFLALKDVRLLQLGRRAVAAAAGAFGGEEGGDGSRRSLMERVVAEDRIPYGSSLYRRGVAQFRANLRALLERYRRAGVPVFIGTVVANERDQPPFISGHSRGVDLETWRRHFDAGLEALRSNDPEAALASFEAAIALDDVHADVHFGRGRALEALGRHPEARRAYLAARDRDELRFRAPLAINEVVREVAAEEGAQVVEVERAFVEASENGIVGRELMLEHVHPNVGGYFLMADAFYDAMKGDEDLGLGPWEHPVPENQARREMPVTEVDRLYGEYRILRLTAGWPFSDGDGGFHLPPSETRVERIARGFFEGAFPWPDAMRRLLDHYRAEGEIGEAATVAVLLAETFPHRREDQLAAARLLRRAGRSDYRIYSRRAHEQRATVLAGQ